MAILLYLLGCLIAFMYLQEVTFKGDALSIQELTMQVCAATIWPLFAAVMAYQSRYEFAAVATTLADLWRPTLEGLEFPEEDTDSDPPMSLYVDYPDLN